MKKSTWIVLGFMVLLGAIYYLTKEKEVSVGVKKIKLPTFAKENADRIEILGKEKVELIKKDNKWWLKIKIKDAENLVLADPATVESMLDAALSIKHSYYVTELKEKYEDLGLTDDKKNSVNVFDKDKVLWSLELGKSAENSARFAKIPNDPAVYAVTGSFWQLTRGGPNDWRDKNILSLSDDESREFELWKKGNLILSLLRKDEKSDWTFTQKQTNMPKDFRAKQSNILTLVKAGTSLRASGFIDEKLPLGEPDFILNIKDKASNNYKISFFGPKDQKYIAVKDGVGQLFEISHYNFERINRSLEDLRDLSVIKINSSDINKMSIYLPNGPINLLKKDGKWELDFDKEKLPKDFIFDPETVVEKLNLMQNLSAKRLSTAKDAPKNPKWQIKPFIDLSDKDGKKISIFMTEILKDSDHVLMKGNIDHNIYVVSKAEIESLRKGLDSFKKVEFELPPIDERTKGFNSLPVDVQRKLLDAAKKKK